MTGSEIYSTAIESGNTVYLSGVIGVDKDGQLVEGDIKDRTTAALERTGERLAALGLDLSDGTCLSLYRCDLGISWIGAFAEECHVYR